MSTSSRTRSGAPQASLVGLLGEQRAAIVEHCKTAGDASVPELATELGISEVATRRHVQLLEDEGFLAARTVNPGRGRPVARYSLTDHARGLFPHRYAAVAEELLEFITTEHGREGLRAFLRWRSDRAAADLDDVVTSDDLTERLEQLASALSAQGYDAEVTSDGDSFTLRQTHCAILDVARDHPELCAHEAATFAHVLGEDVHVSRRLTLAQGDHACVCSVTPRSREDAGDAAPTSD